MKTVLTVVLLMGGAVQMAVAVVGDEQVPPAATATPASAADGNGSNSQKSPALTGVRRPLYRLRKSDAVEIRFTFSPELDQEAMVEPDGFIALKGVGNVFAEGLTISELHDTVRKSYAQILQDPDVTIILKDFEKPFFLAGGQVARPGKYELRSPTTVAEAVAIAGGFTDQSKHSQVVVFRKVLEGVVESHVLNLKAMLASRNLEEDFELEPGDLLFVPQNRISKIRRFLPVSTLSTYLSPTQF
jgi:polysaccharide export outer membrane protein